MSISIRIVNDNERYDVSSRFDFIIVYLLFTVWMVNLNDQLSEVY